ncbi:hypothetical protein CARUB_v10016617mg [Capsella rubella]|uniref:Probable zinc-ribbon domain-containing protein n=2 Tax=Capsella rubella TaxID=81985 RepID=R0HH71_9BRAS|nr:hypothetical protein CARUB_v10016617mg [Capsella rubella]
MGRADEFSVTGDSEAFSSARTSPYNSRSNTSQWKQHEGRYEDPPQVPFYPASLYPSSAYEYGYSSPSHGSHVSALEQPYYHHQPNQFKQYGREGWRQESSVASPTHFPGATLEGKYYPRSSQSPRHDLQYHNLYESSSSATPHRSEYSERSYQAAAAPHHSTYSKHSVGIYKSDTSSEKRSLKGKKRYVGKRNHVVKHHILPSAGGAPFATCSYCLEILQLPQVSPKGKHKRYQVRCGSCSGILKFSNRGKADTILDSPSFLDSDMGIADETVINHQDSAIEGHEEIYLDGSHLSCLDDDFGDTICKSTNDVILSRSLETFEDKGIKEDRENLSSILLDSQLEALQPDLKPLVNHRLRKQQPASSDTIAETSRIYLEQSQEAHSEKSTEMDNSIFERVVCNLEESEYEKREIIKPKVIVGEGSAEFLEVPVYKNKMRSESREEAERVAEKSISHSEELLYKNEYICETSSLSENTKDTEVTRENEEYGDESTWEEIIGDKHQMHLEKSQYIGDSIYDSSLRYGETFEDTSVKEDTEKISNAYSDAMPATPQSSLESLVNENQRFIEHHDQSCEAIVTTSMINEKSKHEYENLREKQDLEMTISDRVRYELEESIHETNETLEESKVGEDRYSDYIENANGAGEKRLVSYQMDSPRRNLKNSYGTLEPVYLEGSGFSGEKTWEETMEDRAGLQLEEYESNYEYYSRSFCMHDYELVTILEPDEDPDGRSKSISQISFNNDGGAEERGVRHVEEPQLVSDGKTEQLQVCEMEKDTVSLDLECGKESMKPDETFEWTSGRTLTFRHHGCQVGKRHEPDEDADGRSGSSSRDFVNDTNSSKERAVIHENGAWLVDDHETKAGQVCIMAEDGPSLHLEKCKTEKMELDETLDPHDDIFRLSVDGTLEQKTMKLMSQDKQENPGTNFKQGDIDEDVREFSSHVTSEGHKSPSKMAEVDSEGEEEIPGDHIKHYQKENEKSELTSEPYAHIYSTTEPSEIVGLRLALYQTQNSPLRSPLTSPIHTPIGSPLHYLMASQIRSPIASTMHSHIVSRLRYPINSSGSLSDVSFLSKKS